MNDRGKNKLENGWNLGEKSELKARFLKSPKTGYIYTCTYKEEN